MNGAPSGTITRNAVRCKRCGDIIESESGKNRGLSCIPLGDCLHAGVPRDRGKPEATGAGEAVPVCWTRVSTNAGSLWRPNTKRSCLSGGHRIRRAGQGLQNTLGWSGSHRHRLPPVCPGLILRATNRRKQDLAAAIERTLTQDARALLDALLVQPLPTDGAAPGKTTAYKLTLMKKPSQSTKPSKVKERVADLALVEDLYQRLTPVLEALALNPEGIAYHANSVIKSEIFQLARREEEDRYLHLIAFIAHQYYRLEDNLVDVLLISLQSYQNGALREHKEQCYARREQRNPSLQALIDYLDGKLLNALATIRAITEDPQLTDAEKVQRIRALLAAHEEASASYDEAKLAALKRDLESELSEDDYYRILEARSVRLHNRREPDPEGHDLSGRTQRPRVARRHPELQGQRRGHRQDRPAGIFETRRARRGDRRGEIPRLALQGVAVPPPSERD